MDLPVEDSLRWIVRSYATFLASHGRAVGTPSLVLPTGEFFPDEFRGDGSSVERLLRRIVSYAPIADDLPIEIALVDDEPQHGGGCGSAGCGTGPGRGAPLRAVAEHEDGYVIFLSPGVTGHAYLLTAALAAGVGGIVIHESGDTADSDPSPEVAEIAAVACGFGVLLVNGAAVWAKSCGGLRLARATALGVEETAVALALFVAVGQAGEAAARRHMQATQREAWDMALAWTASNPWLIETLRDRPGELAQGAFGFEPVRGPLGRWLHRRRLERELRGGASERRPLSAEQKRRLEDARALVDEVLGGE